METSNRGIGVLGGTFDPIHLGHLFLAERVRQLLKLQKVIFIPANLPPHKKKRRLASAADRYHMVALAVRSNPCFEVSDLEIKRGNVSYSVETLRLFKLSFVHKRFFLIVGSDSVREFSTWKDLEQISKICKIVIISRPGYSLRWPGQNSLARLRSSSTKFLDINALDISSTNIRKDLKYKRSIRYLVPEAVRKYILKKKLYRC